MVYLQVRHPADRAIHLPAHEARMPALALDRLQARLRRFCEDSDEGRETPDPAAGQNGRYIAVGRSSLPLVVVAG